MFRGWVSGYVSWCWRTLWGYVSGYVLRYVSSGIPDPQLMERPRLLSVLQLALLQLIIIITVITNDITVKMQVHAPQFDAKFHAIPKSTQLRGF